MKQLTDKDTELLMQLLEDRDVGEFLGKLDNVLPSVAYVFIRDNIKQKHTKIIHDASDDVNHYYQTFQDIKIKAKQSWDHDHKTATMEDVDRACTNLYTLVLRIIKVYSDSMIDELNAVHSAINKVEEKLGLDITDWEQNNHEECQPTDDTNDNGGNDDVGNVQGVQENI